MVTGKIKSLMVEIKSLMHGRDDDDKRIQTCSLPGASSVVVHIESGGSNIIFLLFSISVL